MCFRLIGADHVLVNYTELYEYFGKLAGESGRMTAQSHAAFPLLFNGIFYGSASDEPIF